MFWKYLHSFSMGQNKTKQIQTNLFLKATVSNSALSPEWGGRAQPWVHGEHQCTSGDCSAEQRRRDLLMAPASSHNSDLLFHVFTFESKLYFLLWQIHARLKYHEIFGTVLCQKMPKVADLLEKIVILPTYSSGNDVVPPVLLKETEGVYYSVHLL